MRLTSRPARPRCAYVTSSPTPREYELFLRRRIHHQGKQLRQPASCRSSSFDPDLGAVLLLLYQLDVAVVDAADADDAVPVADVAVVEDEASGGRVVANVVDVGVGAGGDAVRGEGSGQLGDLLDLVEVAEAQREG
jgi:hypothetical protein